MAKQFLNNAYGLASSNHTKQLYKDWAEPTMKKSWQTATPHPYVRLKP